MNIDRINYIDQIERFERCEAMDSLSAEEYESIEGLKLQLLQSRAAQAKADIAAGNLIDGDAFFDELDAGPPP